MATTFKLYDSTGAVLKYTFPIVFQANYPHTGKKLIEHESVRAKGSIIVDGGDESWDLVLKGVISATGYDSVMAAIDTMESTVLLNTAYYIKITKSAGGSTTYDYKCKRLTPIEYQEDSLRTDFVEYTVTLRVNCW